jgi:hypothetical protein
MKKEALLAVFVGLAVGLLLTVLAIQARQRLNPQAVDVGEQNETTPTPSAIPHGNGEIDDAQLTLLQPENESVTTEQELIVTGKTFPEGQVMIQAGSQYIAEVADAKGIFSAKVVLKFGGNIIVVKSIDAAGTTAEATRHITYYPVAITEDMPYPLIEKASSSSKPTASPKTSPKASPQSSGSPKPSASSSTKKASPSPSATSRLIVSPTPRSSTQP